jgi:hypothetical protein
MVPFLKLEDFLAPLPLPALIAVLMVLGLKYLGDRFLRKLGAESPQPIQAAAAFLVVAALAAAALHLLALLGVAYLWLLRLLAWSLAGLGILELWQYDLTWLSQILSRVKLLFQEQSGWGKAAVCLIGITGFGLLLAALGPPTDADSLDYHLGVPLDILRHHGVYPRPDWFLARMAGLGEYLNLLGLAGGTDIFGASLQFAGLLAVLLAVNSLTPNTPNRILVTTCVLGCPVLAFLVPNQKPQMLAAAATTIAALLLATRSRSLDFSTIFLAFACIFFAISCKYSFLISGIVLLGIGMFLAYRGGLGGTALIIALGAYLVLLFPLHWQNYSFYGDPVSPLLERFKDQADPSIIRFASLHRISSGQPFLISLILPTSMGDLTTVLGIGVLLIFLVFLVIGEIWTHSAARVILVMILLVTPLCLVLSSVGARYFLEPYLWIVALAALAPWSPAKNLFFKAMVGQMLIMALVAVFGAATLFPGALTTGLRHQVMARAAYEYNETQWLDQILPQDAVVLAEIRSGALLPRPFLSGSLLAFTDLDNINERKKLISMIDFYQVNTLVAGFPLPNDMIQHLGDYLGSQLAGPKEFEVAVRNPWNKGPAYSLAVYRLRPKPASAWKNEARRPETGGTP